MITTCQTIWKSSRTSENPLMFTHKAGSNYVQIHQVKANTEMLREMLTAIEQILKTEVLYDYLNQKTE